MRDGIPGIIRVADADLTPAEQAAVAARAQELHDGGAPIFRSREQARREVVALRAAKTERPAP